MWKKLAFVVSVCSSVVYSTDIHSHQWVLVGQGALPPSSGNSNRRYARGEDDCAMACSQSDDSLSFIYVGNAKECRCHDLFFGQLAQPYLSEPSSKYFERRETSRFVCPQGGATSVKTAILPGGTTFKFKTFLGQSRTFSEAESICASEGARLFEITTRVKLSFARQLLSCPELQNKRFWVDGVRAISGQWETTDGAPLLMTLEYWNTIPPVVSNSSLCVWMPAALGHKWEGRTCGVNDFETFTLCEKLTW